MTLIKWPGGKKREIREFEHLIPHHERYIEPFFGGGALFFHLAPTKAVINDISTNLVNFYSLVKEQNEEFKYVLLEYDNLFSNFKENAENNIQFLKMHYLEENLVEIGQVREFFPIYNYVDIIKDEHRFYDILVDSINDKIVRTNKNNKKKSMCEEDIRDNLITGVLSGVYLYFRSIYNDIQLGNSKYYYSKEYRIANFFWIREYCYGSMFRYNSKGEFNIPYGGISYNKKNFKRKINEIFSSDTKELFNQVKIYNKDFEDVLSSVSLNENDFIFLDPPYDTEFSAYEGRNFEKNDQKRLRDFLLDTKAKFLLVIKNTDFIYQLYDREEFNFTNFDKQYTYNVRSRNDRNVSHLIITNYPVSN